MIVIKAFVFVIMLFGVMVGMGYLIAHFPSLNTVALRIGDFKPFWSTILHVGGIILSAWTALSIK